MRAALPCGAPACTARPGGLQARASLVMLAAASREGSVQQAAGLAHLQSTIK